MTDTPDPRAALADELTSFFNFINEPPACEDQRMVRDYRHSLAHLWMPLHDKIVIALRSPSPYSGAAREAIDAAILAFGNSRLGNHSMVLTIAGKPTKLARAFSDAIISALTTIPRDADAMTVREGHPVPWPLITSYVDPQTGKLRSVEPGGFSPHPRDAERETIAKMILKKFLGVEDFGQSLEGWDKGCIELADAILALPSIPSREDPK